MRFFFEISYNGTNYHGWQSQPNAVSVQQTIEEHLDLQLQTEVSIVASGRTDTGVHCEQQYFHLDFDEDLSTTKFLTQINSFLPKDIAIKSIRLVRDEAHARFDAIKRIYIYRIATSKDPFELGSAMIYKMPLDIHKMNEAAKLLVGKKDFQAFSKVKTDVTDFTCNISFAEWHRQDNLLIFRIEANRFLRGMVRAIVGTLMEVGKDILSIKEVENILLRKDRTQAGAAAPAHGLYLSGVSYPKDIFIR